MPGKPNKDKKVVIVKWIGGIDDGVFSKIHVDWLKNFDEKKWRETPANDRETDIAEWRKGKRSSWKVHNCLVIETTEDESYAAKKVHALNEDDGEDALSCKEDSNTVGGDVLEEEHDNPKGKADLEDKGAESEDDAIKPCGLALKRKLEQKTVEAMELENKKLKIALAESMLKSGCGLKAGSGATETSKNSETEGLKVPLYPGSGIMVDSVSWNAAKTSGNRATFVGDMLMQLFPKHILVVSNIRGGKPKGQGDGMHRWALDKTRRNALVGAAICYWPGTKKRTVHEIIMRRINSLRLKLKTKGQLEKYEDEGKEALHNTPHALEEED